MTPSTRQPHTPRIPGRYPFIRAPHPLFGEKLPWLLYRLESAFLGRITHLISATDLAWEFFRRHPLY
jgi:hypothetical protein